MLKHTPIFSSFLFSALMLMSRAETSEALSAPQVSQIAESITVRIDGQNPGSGVLIQQNGDTYTILTAAHVVATEDEYEIVTADETRYLLNYQRVKKLPDVDLALVQFESNQDYQVAEMGDSKDVKRGESVYVSGFPMPNRAITEPILNFSPGSITAHAKRPLADGYAYVYTNKTLPGMSGGAVLNEDGQLVGIHGRADTEQTVQETETIYLKTGFNLGIPMYTFLSLASTLDTTPVPTPVTPSAEDLYLSGGNKSQNQDYQGAIADMDQAIALEPEFGEAYYRRYYAREQLGDPNAKEDRQRAIALLNQDLDKAEEKHERINRLIENLERRLR
ncbi:MAG: trypsin-like peptidase domain-containing protein [Acaryochloridaceae cyanobacterium RL_2_7]|nr:trypsin-like peptidase domain-containing protein [Acaryochloridaceae cyanobacterium RL_2_7]